MHKPAHPSLRSSGGLIALTFLMSLAVYAASRPVAPNFDGIAYRDRILGAAPGIPVFPGHLLFGPLVAFAWRGTALVHPIPLLDALQSISHLAGALGVVLTAIVARHWGAPGHGQLLAALGLSFSSAYWLSAADAETYPVALLAVVASLLMATRFAELPTGRRAAALAIANVFAALAHLQLVSLATASVLLVVAKWRRDPAGARRAAGVYVACMALGLGLPYLLTSFVALHHRSPFETIAWLLSASAGATSAHDWQAFPRAAYGFARIFLFLEFFDVAARWILLLKGLALLLAGGWALYWLAPRLSRLPGAAQLVLLSHIPFVLLHSVFGVLWYPSEPERWIFFLPLIWAAVGATVPLLPARQRLVAATAVAAMACVNLASAIWPMAADTSMRDRALALQRALRPGAVMVRPGHDWFGYYGFFTQSRLPTITLLDLAREHPQDPSAFAEELSRRLRQFEAEGRPIALIRVFDPSDTPNSDPWPQLVLLGYGRAQMQKLLRAEDWEETRLDDAARTRLYWRRGPGDIADTAPPASDD
jgi:hypothetical protein